MIEIHADQLDVTNGYDWVALAIASPGANADYYAVVAELYGGRYLQGAASPTALS